MRNAVCLSFSIAAVAVVLPRPAQAAADIEWIRIQGGTFLMGSDEKVSPDPLSDDGPRHKVTVRTFLMSKTLVTNRQYQACVDVDVCLPAHYLDRTCAAAMRSENFPKGFTGPEQPVICVDWDQAHVFAKWTGARLPSEAEWEYAARSGGKDRAYPWGDQEATCDRAIVADDMMAPCCGRRTTWPVCSKPKGNTEQGLCDMVGNAGQWVEDDWLPSYSKAPTDGSPGRWTLGGGASRVYRGGSCDFPGKLARATHRLTAMASGYNSSFGLRLVRDIQEQK